MQNAKSIKKKINEMSFVLSVNKSTSQYLFSNDMIMSFTYESNCGPEFLTFSCSLSCNVKVCDVTDRE